MAYAAKYASLNHPNSQRMGQALYDRIGVDYAAYRRPDPRIAMQVAAALGTARTVLNVGAGSGSYEPTNRSVIAVEPSAEMLRQRAPATAPVVQASAERLPVRSRAFDASLAILTIHHWSSWRQGLSEMQRVSDRVVLLTWDPAHPGFWLVQDYFPDILTVDRKIFPSLQEIGEVLGPLDVRPLPIPGDCTDGFLGAYWQRPERYLDPGARRDLHVFAATAG
jgi:hypothetical protein